MNKINVNLNNNELKATLVSMSPTDDPSAENYQSQTFYLSKYFNIPFRADLADGIDIKIERMKFYARTDYKSMF